MNTTACHAWAEGAAKSAELRYWMARRDARRMDCTEPGLSAAIATWDGSHDTWGALLELAVAHDSGAASRLAEWGLRSPQVRALS